MQDDLIGYDEALKLTHDHIRPLRPVDLPLVEGANHCSASDLHAKVDSPSADASLKDGYAVRAENIKPASPENPVSLRILDVAAAGVPSSRVVENTSTIQILTGAKIPQGADAVLAKENIKSEKDSIIVSKAVEPGCDILPMGTDIVIGDLIVRTGDLLSPGRIGLLAAGGIAEVRVTPLPRVSIIATGDEIVLPGNPLEEGKLYASNLTSLHAWCRRYGMKTHLEKVADHEQSIADTLDRCTRDHDAVLTSGGAWSGDRDLVPRVLTQLGWKKIYHRVRIGPGKAVGFGFLKETPIFILPGGPPSNLMAFIYLVLPALYRMAGNSKDPLEKKAVRLSKLVYGKDIDWTQFIFGKINEDNLFTPLRGSSRLKSMAEADGVISIPEGEQTYPAGETVNATMLK